MTDHDPYAAEESVPASGNDQKAATTAVTPPPPPPPATTGVPSGSSREIMEWVGKDKTKANAALQQEKTSGQPRKGLLSDLQEMLKK